VLSRLAAWLARALRSAFAGESTGYDRSLDFGQESTRLLELRLADLRPEGIGPRLLSLRDHA
jgi:hypothetical protein